MEIEPHTVRRGRRQGSVNGQADRKVLKPGRHILRNRRKSAHHGIGICGNKDA
jgi:hypothetical protein